MEGYVRRDAPGWSWKANGRDNDGRFDFLVVDPLAYGAGPPLHYHANMEDSFFVVEGILTVQLGDEVVELGPGDFATDRLVSRTASQTHTQARLRAGRSTCSRRVSASTGTSARSTRLPRLESRTQWTDSMRSTT
jgi:hypothetical protein